ncbi:MAG: type II secretion system protein [Candidatus Acidiferrales bacterium]
MRELRGKHVPVCGRRVRGCAGFTLIELLVVIAIIGIILPGLLPPVQSDREEHNRQTAEVTLRLLWPCVLSFVQSTGHFPASFAQLDPDCLDAAGLLSAQVKQGYVFTMNGGGAAWQTSAEPVFAGITGSTTLVLDATGAVRGFPTPGSHQMRQEAFDKILIAAGSAAADLLALDRDATPQIRSFASDLATQFDLFRQLDANGDVHVSLLEILNFSPPPDDDLSRIVRAFLAEVAIQLKAKPGPGNETLKVSGGAKWENIPLGTLFDYASLCQLTTLLVHEPDDGDVADSLCEKLAAAKAAEERGDLGAKAGVLRAYLRQLSAQTDKTITRRHAFVLAALAKTLCADCFK